MVAYDSLSEIILYVEDMERMASFYRDVLGLEIEERAAEHGFVRFDTGACNLCLHAGRDGDIGRFAPKVVFDVEDVEEARDHLLDHDVEVGEIREPGHGIRVCDGRDPEGNTFSLESSAS